MMSDFRKKVISVVKEIPAGETMTYGQVAAAAGHPGAARAVGKILKGNYDRQIPCHRVVLANGNIGQYNRGVKLKRQLLYQEGALS